MLTAVLMDQPMVIAPHGQYPSRATGNCKALSLQGVGC